MIHVHICWGDIYGYIPLHSSHTGLKWHVPCCMFTILVYYCNKQASNVLLSIQSDTNVSQLLRRVLPWSYDPLPSLGELSSSSLNRLSVCLCVCFVCVSHQWCKVGLYCDSSVSEWLFLQREKKGVFIFYKKMGKFFFKKNGLTSGLTRVWRQTSDVDPIPPHGLTSVATTKSMMYPFWFFKKASHFPVLGLRTNFSMVFFSLCMNSTTDFHEWLIHLHAHLFDGPVLNCRGGTHLRCTGFLGIKGWLKSNCLKVVHVEIRTMSHRRPVPCTHKFSFCPFCIHQKHSKYNPLEHSVE